MIFATGRVTVAARADIDARFEADRNAWVWG